MVEKFNPGEILEIAVKVEETGKKLFGALEVKAKDEKIKKVWRFLKEQEENHIEVFKDLLTKVEDYIIYDFSGGDYDSYLRAISSEYIFTQKTMEKKLHQEFSSDIEAIDFGIHIEKESIFTYSLLREYVAKEKLPIIDKIIEEEKSHLVRLVSLKEDVSQES